ncbi:M23 family metallopeptidase [Actinokineospora sp.]|uniref:M23 family metallopeptidase n=1 Tax=Actinokineospora sp. TaxID=1872133 RepID=UPI004037E421
MIGFRTLLSLAGTTVVAATFLVVGGGVAAAAPAFQMPFACGQVWEGQTRTSHSPANAVDFNRSGDDGDPVVASAGGRVSRVDNEGSVSYGRWIEIDHGSGWRTRYAHLSAQRVSVGQNVSQGQLIGNVGNTGGSSGAHLHFEQTLNGSAQKIVFNGAQIFYWGTRSYTSRNKCSGGSNPYTPQEVCGSAYSVIDSAALGSSGTAYLLYNSANGNNCVTTIKAVSIGTPSSVSAFLEVQGGTRTTDSGSFGYYAGPVAKSAAGKCVKWGGSVGSSSYTSPFEHCG